MYYVLSFIVGFVLGALLLALVYKNISKKNLSNEKLTLLKSDLILKVNDELVCGKDIKPGQYTVLSSNEDVKSFNLKISGIVREYKNNSSIVLAEKDTIVSVSHIVILRK